jgi:hypothetical protein
MGKDTCAHERNVFVQFSAKARFVTVNLDPMMLNISSHHAVDSLHSTAAVLQQLLH